MTRAARKQINGTENAEYTTGFRCPAAEIDRAPGNAPLFHPRHRIEPLP